MEIGPATDGSSATSDAEAPTMEGGDAADGSSATSDEEAPTDGGAATSNEETGCRPSLNSLALVRKAIPRTYISSDDIEEWRRAVYTGVLLENNTQKFWVDEKLHKNCLLVLPKACDIAGDGEESCWSWITKEEKCFPTAVDILVPKSKESLWLLIQGRFKTRALSPYTTYQVAFVVKRNRINSSSLWRQLVMPDGTKQHREGLEGREMMEEWIYIHAGQFEMDPTKVGTIHFSIHGRLSPKDEGLTIGGVLIRPKA